MKPYDTISIQGYDLVASAQVSEGGTPYNEAIVLNNNSSVYIVAMRISDGVQASVRNVFPYNGGSESSAISAYRLALHDMVACALTH